MAKARKKARKAAKRPARKRKAAKSKSRKPKTKARRAKPREQESFVDAVTGAARDARQLRGRLAGKNTFED